MLITPTDLTASGSLQEAMLTLQEMAEFWDFEVFDEEEEIEEVEDDN